MENVQDLLPSIQNWNKFVTHHEKKSFQQQLWGSWNCRLLAVKVLLSHSPSQGHFVVRCWTGELSPSPKHALPASDWRHILACRPSCWRSTSAHY